MIDSRLGQILDEVMGPNVRKQLYTVAPDFFDKDYVVMQMQPKPESEQPFGYLNLVAMEPIVVASNHPKYGEGTAVNLDEGIHHLKEMLRDDYNITVSPVEIIRKIHVPPEEVESGPFDPLVIAELDVYSDGFYNTNEIYHHRYHIPLKHYLGIEIPVGELCEYVFGRAMLYGYVHFAFLPQEPGVERDFCYIYDGWELESWKL